MNIPNCVPEFYRSMWEDEAHEAELEMERQNYYERNKAYRRQKYIDGCDEIQFYPDECVGCSHGEEANPDSEWDDIPTIICNNWKTCPVYRKDFEEHSNENWNEHLEWHKTCAEKMKLIGKTYEDPEGVWEITELWLVDNSVTVRQIQKGNLNYWKEMSVPIGEAEYYLNGGK